MFGVETILIYTALLLKKKIAVYFPPHSLQDLLQFTRQVWIGYQKLLQYRDTKFLDSLKRAKGRPDQV